MLYHYQVYMPNEVLSIVPKNRVKLVYGKHALEAAQNDKYGNFCLPLFIDYANTTIVEICTTEKKIVARFPIDATRDCVIVTIPARETGKHFVKTVWINERNDKHRTLDSSRYQKAKR